MVMYNGSVLACGGTGTGKNFKDPVQNIKAAEELQLLTEARANKQKD